MTADELFNVLLWGSGGWIGLLIILLVTFVIFYKLTKLSVVILMPMLFMLSLEYLDRVPGDSRFMWSFIICWIAMIIIIADAAVSFKRGR